VTEAKRQVFGEVGIDGLAGPSELVVIAGGDVDPELVALDLLAQAEHGPDSRLQLIALDNQVLEGVVGALERLAPGRPSVEDDVQCGAWLAPDARTALQVAEQLAPEHLELVGEEAEALAGRVTRAGCVFVGASAGTAFGDYVAGSNHVLPTTKSGRFSGPLGPGAFRRRISKVELDDDAAAELAPHVDVLSRAEGLPVHGESAMIRKQ
jgi:histidinol dehydrogenase